MPTQREIFIDEYFLNISANKNYLELFYVRQSILNAVKENIPKFNGVILDVGCGIMPYRELILDNNKTVTTYIGLDFENSLSDEYDALGKADLFWKGDIIPMEDNSVDTILSIEVFEHCPEPEKVMREILRVLKPGGVLFFTVPFLWNLHLVPYDEYRYTPFALERLLKNAGFTNINMSALGGFDASLAQILAIWYQNRPMRGSHKNILGKLLVPIIKRLIKSDMKVDKKNLFKQGSLITGISGIAYKE